MDFRLLNLLIRCCKEYSHKKILRKDMSETECYICSYVYSRPNCTQYDVAEALKIDKTTLAKALRTLEEKNFIERTKDDNDKRVNRLVLTEICISKISDIITIHNDWMKEVAGCLLPEEQEQLEGYCERLLAAAEELLEKSKEEDTE